MDDSGPRWPRPNPAAVEALAPSGTLRAAVNLSNFLLVSGRDSDGTPTGISPAMARALASTLDVDLAIVSYAHPGELADAVVDDEWDIGNIGADPDRAELIAFTAPYVEIECTYLVRAESPVAVIDDVDRPGHRIVTKARAAYSLWLERNIAHAELIPTSSTDESFERFVADDLEVLAGLRPRLLSDAGRLPGARLLPGHFTAVPQAIGTPRARAEAGLDHLQRFVRTALDSGFVTELIETYEIEGLTVAAVSDPG